MPAGRRQRSRRGQLGPEQRDALVLVERSVVVGHATDAQQLVDHLGVHGRVLAEVERAEVEAERRHGIAQPTQPTVRQQAGAVGPQRPVDRVEIAEQVLG